jgi:RNA polymerase sigma factor (sigma-70 family)
MRTETITYTRITKGFESLCADIRSTCPLIDKDEEMTLLEEYATASEERRIEIRNTIVNGNMRFVLSVAKKYTNDGSQICDLVSLGAIGLCRAVETFEPARGFRFISYAVNYIRAEFRKFFVGDANLVRRSNNVLVGSKDEAVKARFIQTEMREPTEDEIIDALKKEYGINIREKLDVVEVKAVSINNTISSDSESTLEDTGEIAMATASRNEYENQAEQEHKQAAIKALLSGLTVREQQMVCMAFGVGYEQEYQYDDIAEKFGCTGERVRQLVQGALKKMSRRTDIRKAM